MDERRDSPEVGLGLPYTVNKTRQVKGSQNEVKMAKDRGARVHPMSGAGRIKDDASTEDTLYEFKQALRTHTLNGLALLALFVRAVKQEKTPKYVIYFEKADITATIYLSRGNHEPSA